MPKRPRSDEISSHFPEVGDKDEISQDTELIPDEFVLEEPNPPNGSTGSVGYCMNLWTPEATRWLIILYKKHINEVGRPPLRSMKDMFERISGELRVLGHDYSAQRAENKWRVLERKYKRHEAIMEKTGGRIPTKLRRFMYFEHKGELDDIFGPMATNVKGTATGTSAKAVDKNARMTHTPGDGSFKSRSDDQSLEDFNGKIVEKVVDRLTSCLERYFGQIEENNERRHEEITAIRLNELEIQRHMLGLKREELLLKMRFVGLVKERQGNASDDVILS